MRSHTLQSAYLCRLPHKLIFLFALFLTTYTPLASILWPDISQGFGGLRDQSRSYPIVRKMSPDHQYLPISLSYPKALGILLLRNAIESRVIRATCTNIFGFLGRQPGARQFAPDRDWS